MDERLIEDAWMRSHIASSVWANRCVPHCLVGKRGFSGGEMVGEVSK